MDDNYRDDFFTKTEIIQQCAFIVKQIVPQKEFQRLFFIDSSAGTNEFAMHLQRPYWSVDKYIDDYTQYHPPWGQVAQMDWFDCRYEDLLNCIDFTEKKNMILGAGFNYPFGHRHQLIHEFIDHTVNEFHPDYFFLIVPKQFHMNPNLSYSLVFAQSVGGNAFYRPRRHNGGYEKECGVLCEFRIYKKKNFLQNNAHDDLERVNQQKLQLQEQEFKNRLESKIEMKELKYVYTDDFQFPSHWNPQQTCLIRCWGRLTGRTFIFPLDNGTLQAFYNDESTPRITYNSWGDFQKQVSGRSFIVFYFHFSIDRQKFRQQWLLMWRKIAAHSFDAQNQVRMTLKKKQHCYPILLSIF